MKSVTELVYNYCKDKPVGARVTTASIYSRHPNKSKNNINTALFKMRDRGYLDGDSRGEYIVNRHTANYLGGYIKSFRKPWKKLEKAEVIEMEPQREVHVEYEPEADPLNKLLEAFANTVAAMEVLKEAISEVAPELVRAETIKREVESIMKKVG